MKVWGLTPGETVRTLESIGLQADNVRADGRALRYRIIPPDSRHKYARRAASGRRVKACSYEGFRDGIRALFRAGSVRVQTTLGDWSSLDAFESDLPRLARVNVGSLYNPVPMADLSNWGDA